MHAVCSALTSAGPVLQPVDRIGGPDAHRDHHIAINVVCHSVKVALIFADAARCTVHGVSAPVLRQSHHVASEEQLLSIFSVVVAALPPVNNRLEVDSGVEGCVRVDE